MSEQEHRRLMVELLEQTLEGVMSGRIASIGVATVNSDDTISTRLRVGPSEGASMIGAIAVMQRDAVEALCVDCQVETSG